MSDETIIPPAGDPAINNDTTPVEDTQVSEVAQTPETETAEASIDDVNTESSDSIDETQITEETTSASDESSEAASDVSATPVRSTPLTALSARPERPSRGQGGGRNDRGGDRGGRRDDRRGGKSGFEQVKKEFEEVLLEVGRVTKVTSGGRQLRFRAAVVIGDRNGRVGFGLGKAQEVSVAVEKAVNSAKRHLIKVPLVNGTVPHDVQVKFKSVKLMIHPATEGTGIIAGGSARRILELAGCQNILSKRHGGRNVITTAYATIEALKMYQVKNERTSFAAKKPEKTSEALA